jgi:hypothetical protein
MPDEHRLTSYQPHQDLGTIARNIEVALARLAGLPTRATVVGAASAAMFGAATLVIVWLEVFGRACR